MDLSLIVCLVDFATSGEGALKRALTLARWHEAELHVLCPRPGRSRQTAVASSSPEHPLPAQLVECIARLDHAGIAITPVALTGDAVKAVAEYARVKSADLVVIGQNGRGSLFGPYGVLATDVARAVPCPTLTVSQKEMADTDAIALFDNIVCGIDFSTASRHALNQALTMAQQSGGRITLLHVLEGFPYESVYSGSRAFRLIGDYRARVDRIRRELRALVPPDALNWCEVEAEVISGIPHDAIRATATARKANLVVIGLSRRTRLDRIVMASTVSGVLRHVQCSVLAVPGGSDLTEVVSIATGVDHYDDEAIALLGARTNALRNSPQGIAPRRTSTVSSPITRETGFRT